MSRISNSQPTEAFPARSDPLPARSASECPKQSDQHTRLRFVLVCLPACIECASRAMMKTTMIAAAFMAAAGLAWVTVAPMPSRDATRESAPTYTINRGELIVSVTEQGTLESANNTEVKCRVRGSNTITFVIESGTEVEAGEELIRLETLAIEEEISERTKFYHLAESQVARSAADVARAKLAISEYEEGRFVSELSSLQKDLAVAESRLLNSKNRLKHSRMMSRSEYASELEVEEKEFASKQSEMNVGLIKTRIEVLKNYTKREELVRLKGELNVAQATWEADVERALADKKRLQRAQEELRLCTIVSDRAGLVIYPDSEEVGERTENRRRRYGQQRSDIAADAGPFANANQSWDSRIDH